MGKRGATKRSLAVRQGTGDRSAGAPAKHSKPSSDKQQQQQQRRRGRGRGGGGGKARRRVERGPPDRSGSSERPSSAKESASGVAAGGLDLSDPGRLLASLLAPAATQAAFLADYWEQRPLVIHRGSDDSDGSSGGKMTAAAAAAHYGLGFSREHLLRLLSEQQIKFGRDINVCRYVASKRQNLNGTGRATAAQIKNLFDVKKATLQFHQPQRFQNKLWQICELLESHFHSLVGANVYMTPGGSQGLAPHYDDVEVLILQLEGLKHWRLYAPPEQLPRDYSRDLTQDTIGEPTHDFVLETGDFLYFPRGTVHQADTPADCPYSTHVTISTYQRSSFGDLLTLSLPNILDSAIHGSVDYRKGLPLGYLANCAKDKSTFERLVGQLSGHVGAHLQAAADQMMCDFVANRLPPYQADGPDAGPTGPMPTDGCRVRLTHPRHVFVTLVDDKDDEESDGEEEEEEEEDDEEDEEEEQFLEAGGAGGSKPTNLVAVRHSLRNSRTDHMMGTDRSKPNGLLFPVNHREALLQLTEAGDDWLDSRRLSLPTGLARDLLVSLWAEGLLEACPE